METLSSGANAPNRAPGGIRQALAQVDLGSLPVLLGLIQDSLKDGLKEFDTAKDPSLKDLVALLKAGIPAPGTRSSPLSAPKLV